MTPPILWTPPDDLLQRATMGAYMRERGFETYAELQRWSVEDLEGFWGSIWDRFGVGERGADVLASREMPGASWFPGTQLNYAEHAFRGRDDDALAIIAGGEDREDAEWTWGELARSTRGSRPACARTASGAATASWPTCRTSPRPPRRSWPRASLGAIWSSCSPDFGARSVIDRFAQIEPKVLLAVRGYRYNGKSSTAARRCRRSSSAMPG